jgi:FAD synthetase
MSRVMATGVFDILHPGHLHFLMEAKSLGDELVVVVATDATVRKHKHEPITPEKMRVEMVGALKPVDRALLGHEGDMFEIVLQVKPDIIALGFDQRFDEKELERRLAERGLRVKVVRMHKFEDDLNGTRKIIQKIMNGRAAERGSKKKGGDL